MSGSQDTDSPVPGSSCAQCDAALGDDRMVLTDRSLCGACYAALAAELARVVESTTTDVNYPLAAVGAVVGGAVGALAWWGFTIVTSIAFGLLAVGIGYLVGHGAVRGSGNKRTVGLQALSAVVAAVSFGAATYLVNMTLLNREFVRRGDAFQLSLLPASLGQFVQVVGLGFGAMDVAFLGITIWQAWTIPRPIRLPGAPG